MLAVTMIFSTIMPGSMAMAKELNSVLQDETVMPETKDNVSPYKIKVEEPKKDSKGNYIMSANGGSVNINYPKEGVKKEDIQVLFFKDDVRIEQAYNIGISEAGSNVIGGEIKSIIPENDTNKEIVYKIFIKEKTEMFFDTKNVLTINVKPLGETVLTGVLGEDNIVVESTDLPHVFTLQGKNLSKDRISYEVFKSDSKIPDINVNFATLGSNTDELMGSIKLPTNDTKEVWTYYIDFFVMGNEDSKYRYTINIQALDEEESNPSNAMISMARLEKEVVQPTDERLVNGNIFGNELSIEDIEYTVEKDDKIKDLEIVFKEVNDKKTKVSFEINVPENKTNNDHIYKIKFKTTSNPTDVVEVTLKVVGSGEVTGIPFEVQANKTELTSSGGEVLFYIEGDNVALENLRSTVKKENDNTGLKVSFKESTDPQAKFIGSLTLPKNETNEVEVYTVNINLLNMEAENPEDRFIKKVFEIKVLPESNTPEEKTVNLTVYENNLSSKGDNATIYLDLKGYTVEDLKANVKLNLEEVLNPEIKFVESDKTEHDLMLIFKVLNNDTNLVKNYEITLFDTDGNKLGVEKFVQEAKEETVSFVNLIEDRLEVESGMESLKFDVFPSPVVDSSKVKLQITKDGKILDLEYKVTGEKARKTVELKVPENKTNANEIYKIKFNATGSDTEFQESPVFTLIVKPKPVEETPVIEDIVIQHPDMPLNSKDNNPMQQMISVKGSNLDIADISYEVYEKTNGEYQIYKIDEKDKFQGTDSLKSVRIPISESEVEREFKVVIKIADITKEVFFKQSKLGTLSQLQLLYPKQSYTIDDDTLIINFYNEIKEVSPGKLKDSIIINSGNQQIKLTDNDSLELKGSKIIIKFKEKIFSENKNYALTILERAFYNKQGLNKKVDKYSIIKNGLAVDSFKFLEGYQLDHKGGKVEIEIKGFNLIDKNNASRLKLKIQENSKDKKEFYNSEIKDPAKNEIKDLVIKGDKNRQIITFTAPENNNEKVKTYIILVSTDGGSTYTSSLPSTLEDRFIKSVIAVLPENAVKDEPMIDFMQIQSYGTVGGGSQADITHTNLPTGQGSKKSLVWIYGTNLDASKTRLRLSDVNGVYWSPIYDAVFDSSDRVMMTMMDSMKDGETFGMSGKGNNMVMEVILPNGYKPDGQKGFPEGVTFEYEVAPDGVNFNEDVKVTGTVLHDGSPKSLDLKEKVMDITVRHINQDGEDIVKPIDVKAYKHLPPNTLFYGLPLVDEKGEFKEEFQGYKVGDTEEIVKGRENTFGHNKFYYDGKNIPELLNSDNELVLIYNIIKEEPTEPTEEIKDTDSFKEVFNKLTTERIKGLNRNITGIRISERLFDSAEVVYLTSSSEMIDSLTSTPNGILNNGPTLFVEKDSIKEEVKAEIKRLNPKKVVIIGGKSVISKKVENIINDLGYEYDRIAGYDRFETAVKIGEEIRKISSNKTDIILANGRNSIDALTASTLAGKLNIPILLTESNSLKSVTAKAIKDWGIKNVIVVGGNEQINKNVLDSLSNDGLKVSKIAGNSRFETAIDVAKFVNPNPKKVIFTNSRSYADALVASYVAVREDAPIILINKEDIPVSVKKYLRENNIKYSIIVGGDQVVAEIK